jgi:hypothetical protein
LGSEGAGIHVLPTERISERAVAASSIAIAITARSPGQKSGASMPMHVDTLIWAFGVLALMQAIDASLNERAKVTA